MVSLKAKVLTTLLSVFIFLAVSMPASYKLTDGVLTRFLRPTVDVNGCPTPFGLAVHTVVFACLVFGSMYVPWKKLMPSA